MLTKEQLHKHLKYLNGQLTIVVPFSKYKPGLVGKELGSVDKHGYRVTRIFGKRMKIHRLVYLYHHGYLPKEVDHINGDRLDNRIENLRAATSKQNCYNKQKSTGKSSKYKGVCFFRATGRWLAYIDFEGKRYHLGYYDSEDGAAIVYNEAALEFFKEYSKLNHICRKERTQNE